MHEHEQFGFIDVNRGNFPGLIDRVRVKAKLAKLTFRHTVASLSSASSLRGAVHLDDALDISEHQDQARGEQIHDELGEYIIENRLGTAAVRMGIEAQQFLQHRHDEVLN